MLFEEFEVIFHNEDQLYHVVERDSTDGSSKGIGETPSAAFHSAYKYLKLTNSLKKLISNQNAKEFIIYMGGCRNV